MAADLVCSICGAFVVEAEIRDHLEEHNPGFSNLDYEEARDLFSLAGV